MLFYEIIQKVRDNLLLCPDSPALITTEKIVTYGMLAQRVEGILAAMQNIQPGLSLIIGHKEPDCVAAMISCVLSGRPFVFCDALTPATRLEDIIMTTQATNVFARECDILLNDLPRISLSKVASLPSISLAATSSGDDETFYVVFTSGSTGRPKGVPVSRGNYAAFQRWYISVLDSYPFGAHVNHANLAFDMGMWDLWPALSLGRPVYLLDHKNNVFPRNNIYHLLSAEQIRPTTWITTPSLLQLMCAEPMFSERNIPSLCFFAIGGEMLPRSLVREIGERFPQAHLFNAYGPSEATCITHLYRLTDVDIAARGPMKIGRSMGETRQRIVGVDGQDVECGEDGELVLSGPQVVRSYLPLNHPANASLKEHDGYNEYYTGDAAKMDSDGNAVIIGRLDRQVKLLGVRVHLEEIESIVEQFGGVQQAVCVPQKDSAGRVIMLSLYVKYLQPQEGTRDDLFQYLRGRLPRYMVPEDLRLVATLPMTPNGKLDVGSLSALTSES